MATSTLQKLINSGWTILLTSGAKSEGGEIILFPACKSTIRIEAPDEIIVKDGDDVLEAMTATVEELFEENEESVTFRMDKVRDNGSSQFIGPENFREEEYSAYIMRALHALASEDGFDDIEEIEEKNVAFDGLLEDMEVLECLATLESELGLIASGAYLEVKKRREEGQPWEQIAEELELLVGFLKQHYIFLLKMHSKISEEWERENLDAC